MKHTDFDKLGFWSPSTASVNWCENNYVVTHYIAEFWNTTSSLVLITAAVLGHILCPSRDRLLLLAWKAGTVIGIGSVMFHGTLRHKMQLLDELPEVYCAAVVFWICIETKFGRQGAWFPLLLGTWLAIVTAVASLASGKTQFMYFQSSFVFMQLWVMYCIGTTYKQQTAKRPSKDQQWLIPRVFSMYLLAVSTWLIDYHLCDYIDGVGPKSITPFNPQLHAWWHVFSAMDAYLFILTVIYQHLEQRQLKPFLYFYKGVVPAIGLETDAAAVKKMY